MSECKSNKWKVLTCLNNHSNTGNTVIPEAVYNNSQAAAILWQVKSHIANYAVLYTTNTVLSIATWVGRAIYFMAQHRGGTCAAPVVDEKTYAMTIYNVDGSICVVHVGEYLFYKPRVFYTLPSMELFTSSIAVETGG